MMSNKVPHESPAQLVDAQRLVWVELDRVEHAGVRDALFEWVADSVVPPESVRKDFNYRVRKYFNLGDPLGSYVVVAMALSFLIVVILVKELSGMIGENPVINLIFLACLLAGVENHDLTRILVIGAIAAGGVVIWLAYMCGRGFGWVAAHYFGPWTYRDLRSARPPLSTSEKDAQSSFLDLHAAIATLIDHLDGMRKPASIRPETMKVYQHWRELLESIQASTAMKQVGLPDLELAATQGRAEAQCRVGMQKRVDSDENAQEDVQSTNSQSSDSRISVHNHAEPVTCGQEDQSAVVDVEPITEPFLYYLNALQTGTWQQYWVSRFYLTQYGMSVVSCLPDSLWGQIPTRIWDDIIELNNQRNLRPRDCVCLRCGTRGIRFPTPNRKMVHVCRSCRSDDRLLPVAEVVCLVDSPPMESLKDPVGNIYLPWSKIRKLFDFDQIRVCTRDVDILDQFLAAVDNERELSRRQRYATLNCVVESPESFPPAMLDRLGSLFACQSGA